MFLQLAALPPIVMFSALQLKTTFLIRRHTLNFVNCSMCGSARPAWWRLRARLWPRPEPEPGRDLPRLVQQQRDSAAGASRQDVLLPGLWWPRGARHPDILGQDGGPEYHQPSQHNIFNWQENVGNVWKSLMENIIIGSNPLFLFQIQLSFLVSDLFR